MLNLSRPLIAAGLLAFAAMPALAKVPTGSPAPQFTLTDTMGQVQSLDALRGKTVILEWTNDRCPYVVKHYSSGNIQATQTAHADADTVWLSVVSSAPGKQGHVSADAANSLTTDRGAMPTAVLLDESGDIGRAYDAKTTPHMYIINPEGTLVYQGAIDSNRSSNPATIAGATNYVNAAMSDLDADRPVMQDDTQPYGCTIKY